MTNVEALKKLYVELGGNADDVADATTSVEVLNAISAKYDGEDDACLNPDAIANIAAIAKDIGGGITPTGTKSITENGTHDVTEYASAEVNVPSEITFRNFTYSLTVEGEEWGGDGFYISCYNSDNQLIDDNYSASDIPTNVQGKLPVINGKCEIELAWDGGYYLTLVEGSSGVTLSPRISEKYGGYILSIDEDNAVFTINVEIAV